MKIEFRNGHDRNVATINVDTENSLAIGEELAEQLGTSLNKVLPEDEEQTNQIKYAKITITGQVLIA